MFVAFKRVYFIYQDLKILSFKDILNKSSVSRFMNVSFDNDFFLQT